MVFKPLLETEEAEHTEDTSKEKVDKKTDGDDDSSNDNDDKDNNHSNDEDNNDDNDHAIFDKEPKDGLDFIPLLLSKKITYMDKLKIINKIPEKGFQNNTAIRTLEEKLELAGRVRAWRE